MVNEKIMQRSLIHVSRVEFFVQKLRKFDVFSDEQNKKQYNGEYTRRFP